MIKTMKSDKPTKNDGVTKNDGAPVKNNATPKETSTLVKEVTLKILSERHNALARYIGVPCVIEASKVLEGAVMTDGCVVQSKEYACYRVDLEPFKGEFDKIRFRAVTNGKNVAFAMLVDDGGNVELIARNDKPAEGTVVMPLTARSRTLFATMPVKKGKPAWKNPTVELLSNGGVIAEVNEALTTLLGKIEALEERLEVYLAC